MNERPRTLTRPRSGPLGHGRDADPGRHRALLLVRAVEPAGAPPPGVSARVSDTVAGHAAGRQREGRRVPARPSRQVAEGIGAGLARAAAGRQGGRRRVGSRPADRAGRLPRHPHRPRSRGAGGAAPLGSAHILATAVRELFPSAGIGFGPPDRGRLLLRLRGGPRPFTPEDLERIEAKMAEVAKRRLPVRARGRGPRRGQPPLRRRSAEAGADLRAGRRRDHQRLHRRAVHRSLPRASHPGHRPAQAFQAAPRRRGLLAGRREAADAPADLRHGLVQEGGPRRLPPPARGGAQARPSGAGAAARPLLDLRGGGPGPGAVASAGCHDQMAADPRGGGRQRRQRLRPGVHAATSPRRSCSRSRGICRSMPPTSIRRWRPAPASRRTCGIG